MDYSYLNEKREKALARVKPICDVFGIKDYDYEIDMVKGSEWLVVSGQKIGCSGNSETAIVDELIGYIFIKRWCRNRSLGAFSKQSQNVIKRYWIRQED